ncbi:MAG: methyltransferase domain-containing protein [Alphaproteobacteria bacterium]|nr:methyltransferase domain-containing protein [Alphaproteobacteria bacterium]
MTHATRIARYYAFLDRLTQLNVMRSESGSQAQPIHRALKDPRSPEEGGGPPSPTIIHRLIREAATLPEAPRVLDAGCGYGATAFDLQPQTGGTWLGITLSPIQVQRATAEAARRGVSNHLHFALQSYDDALPGPFDLIIAIESLIHSTNPAASIANLATHLAPGGQLVIVDDMPEPGLSPEDEADLALFKRMWRCPVAPPAPEWRGALATAGLTLTHEQDLTPLILLGNPADLRATRARQQRRAFWLGLVGQGLREQADIGGRTLELLHLKGAVRYRLLAARKEAVLF